MAEINKAIQDLKDIKFNIEVCGSIEDYVGVPLEEGDGGMDLVQPILIDSILKDVGISNRQPTKKVPAASTKILH